MTITWTPAALLASDANRVYLRAKLRPVAGQNRFQPAGFPEIGHVIYKAPVGDGAFTSVCIVDSAASMANHLETVCMRASHDPELVEALSGLPYVRCVTEEGEGAKPVPEGGAAEVVVTTLTEGHRLASQYFLDGKRLVGGKVSDTKFEAELMAECEIMDLGKRSHPTVSGWWRVFSKLFRYDPNTLVHGVLFPKWSVKIARALTANMEAIGAQRIDRSGVKFDRLQKTTSGQPIFAVDDEAAEEIVATFVLDLALIRSFGRDGKGLGDAQKELLVALALWKVGQLVAGSFRYRSNCDLECEDLVGSTDVTKDDQDVRDALRKIDIGSAIASAGFPPADEAVTDVYWPFAELYDKGTA